MTIKAKFFLFVSRDYIMTQMKKNLAFIFIVWRIYILMFGCKRLKLEVLSILIGNIFFCFSSLFSCLCISPSLKTLFVSVWPEFYVVLAILTVSPQINYMLDEEDIMEDLKALNKLVSLPGEVMKCFWVWWKYWLIICTFLLCL